MYKNQENISDTSGVISKEYSRLSEYSSYIANEWGGGILKGIGGAVIAVGSFSKGLKDGIDGAKSLGGIVKGLFQKGEGAAEGGGGLLSKLFGSKKPEAPATPTLPTPGAAPAAPGGGAASPADQADKVSKIKSGDLIKGAAALLILAVALYVAAKAFQEFANVTWESVGMGLVALAGLATIAFLLSKVEKDMIAGAIAIGILGAALIPFAFALNMMSNVNGDGLIAAGLALVFFAGAMFALGALLFAGGGLGAVLFGAGIIGLIALGAAMTAFGIGLKSVSEGMSSLTSSLPLIVEQISALSQLNFLPIFGLAAALTALAMALSAVAIAGVLALPALAGIGAIAAGVGGLFGGGEKGGENKELLDEIKGLRADLNSGKVAVYMDGYRVTAAVAAANASSPLTLR
jgi:hypothetical protein